VGVILVAAARVFERAGYDAASTRTIAECAGVSVGSLYEYFPSKMSLLAALIDEHIAQGRELLATIGTITADPATVPPMAVLTRSFVEAMLALHAVAPALHRVMFEETRLHPRLRQAVEALEDDMVAATEAVLRMHPEVTVADPQLAAQMVVHIIESLTHRVVIHPRPGDVASDHAEVITRVVTRFLCDGTSPPSA
jgi:AcrR family transcriptional regulator